MSQPFIAEIRMAGFSFAPNGWAFCDGSTMDIAQNDTLFILIGTTYGGDGVQTFNLPNLLGRIPLHQNGSFPIGAVGGTESVTLTTATLPSHNHALAATTGNATDTSPTGDLLATTAVNVYVPPTAVVATSTLSTSAGGGLPHDNLMPYLCINYIISLFGVFPSQ